MNISSPKNDKDTALIIGPTASGKSALALELAKKQPSVIINADSAQVYSDLQILSARPDTEEMQGIDHQLYGYLDGAHPCSAAQWAADAKDQIASAHRGGKLPILVGGTGLYVRTLLDGIAPIPEIDKAVRNNVRLLTVERAYQALVDEDPFAAERLNPNDSSRIMRALEVVRSTGKPLNHWQAHKTGGIKDDINLRPLVLLPPRDWLYSRCDSRFEIMLERGAKEEASRLLARNLPNTCPVMRAIGVPEICAWIEGTISIEEAQMQAMAATRQYAKRQYTWFRNQCPPAWLRYEKIVNYDNLTSIVI
ncbi:MAG: tRNA (adenosine(37)-N6)-dimethylallyltransferase MiaA [Parasphingorhabdus sp.]|uniref:tRNA (adenosine(37)-N6)-dimethylallyltransferase MiaA n=1 Tax=Parasphingorhabdus sp. TaxID=2709688 RepID=UPI003297F46E